MWVMCSMGNHFFLSALSLSMALPQALSLYLLIACILCLHLSSGAISCRDEEMERMKL